ncbi:hypothetical protein BJX64DRAFT_293805 [Aspergillus heterothallicus]
MGGGPILKPETVREIFQPHLVGDPDSMLAHWRAGPLKSILAPSITENAEVNQGLAELLSVKDFERARRKGTTQWTGAGNLIWSTDPASGIAATAFQQILAVGDAEAGTVKLEFEKAIYCQSTKLVSLWMVTVVFSF